MPAAREYYAPARPFLDVAPEDRPPFLLDVEDVAGKRIVSTRLARTVTIREENAAGALEVMSRFAIDPRWLVYLPPTMAPTATSALEDVLEHPAEAFAEFRTEGVARVVCEEKHMGSRAIAVVCRDEEVARSRFGVPDGSLGALYTRTGRPFLDDATAALDRLRAAVWRAGLWDALDTGWLVLDCEILPWSAKAMELIARQYAPVGAAGRAGLSAAVAVSVGPRPAGSTSAPCGTPPATARAGGGYRTAYGRYVWPVAGSTTCASPRSTSWRRSPGCSPAATTAGTCRTATRSSTPTLTGSGGPSGAWSTSPTRRPRRRGPSGGPR